MANTYEDQLKTLAALLRAYIWAREKGTRKQQREALVNLERWLEDHA